MPLTPSKNALSPGITSIRGQEISTSADRLEMDRLLTESFDVWRRAFGKPEGEEKAKRIAEGLGKIRGVSPLQHGGYGADLDYDCIHFAFGTQAGHAWASPHRPLPREWWTSAATFLNDEGYRLQPPPVGEGLVAYSHLPESSGNTSGFRHFGVLQPDGSVTSKFGTGPIVNHPVETVPSSYGDLYTS